MRPQLDANLNHDGREGHEERQGPLLRGQLSVLHGPPHEVPVIGHRAISEYFDGKFLVRFFDYSLERFVVRVLLKKR